MVEIPDVPCPNCKGKFWGENTTLVALPEWIEVTEKKGKQTGNVMQAQLFVCAKCAYVMLFRVD